MIPIQFNCLSFKSVIFALILLIFMFLNQFNLYENQKNIYFENNYPLFSLLKYLSLLLSFFLYYKETKNNDINLQALKKIIRNKNIIDYYKRNKKSNLFLKQNIFILIIISIIDLIDQNYFYFQLRIGGQLAQITSFILFIYLYQQKIYKHHLIAIIMTFVSFILPIKIILKAFSHKKLYLFNSIITFNLFGFNIVFEKYLIEKRYFNRFLLLFYKGIFGIILTIISQLIYFFINKNMLINFKLIFKYKICFFFCFVLTFLEEIIFIILINQTKNIISLFIYIFWKFNLIIFLPLMYKYSYDYDNNIILYKISDILNIIFSLIFMEIIILKFCNYNKNVNDEISKRAEKESLEINKISDE